MTNHKYVTIKKHGVVFCNTLAQARKHGSKIYLVPEYDKETFILCLELNKPLTLWHYEEED